MARRGEGDDLAPASVSEACEHCAVRANEPCVLDCDCPACLERRAELTAWARWHGALGRVFKGGRPLTKAVWLVEATQGDLPDVPLHPELEPQMPRKIWGPVPQTLDDDDELLPDEWGDDETSALASLDALQERAGWDAALALMFERGWPLTKAAYLYAATMSETPDFPLDVELWASIPEDLDGELPESVEEYNQVVRSLPRPAWDDVN